MKEIFDFLYDLKQNNNKEWFDQNRDRYQSTRTKFLTLTDILINEVRGIDDSIKSLDSKDCMFRIFRDVRFSKDKRPYKANYGSFIAPGGRKSSRAGYYIHFEPGQSFIGGGIYCPQPANLRAVRKEIYENPEEFIQLIEQPSFKKWYPELVADGKLKIAPKGFPKDFEHIDLLRYKHYATVSLVDDEILQSDQLVKHIVEGFEVLYDFNLFINRAIDHWK
ncbi:DUF2461 domain-containing protein [Puteibacter caeruleilacunae]|nr:DUF2461 domain-containing protein [Puteibacter caeruleilacunae]